MPMSPDPTPAADPGRPLSIAMISDDFLPAATGVGTHLQTICPQLVDRGHRVAVLTSRLSGEPERDVWRGVDVHRAPTLRVAGFDQALPGSARLAAWLDEVRPDVVHLHYLGVMMLRAMRRCRARGLPMVYTYHMTEDHLTQPWFMRPLRWPIAAGIDRVVNRMHSVISVSEGMTTAIHRRGARVPVETITNPVELPALDSVVPAERDGDFVVLYAGRLEPEKNLPLLLDAFALLARKVPGAVLWIAGRGSQREKLGQRAASLGIADRVRWLGFLGREALLSRYLGCDVFVLPSLVETQGLVAMEAAWAGRPLVVADSVVSAPELVESGRNGWIVDHRAPAEMFDALSRLAADRDLGTRLGDEGRRLAAQWNVDAVIPRLVAHYGQAAGRAG